MLQSTRPDKLHVAIIMDGNGRWATRQGQRRSFGHEAGGDAVRRVVEAAPDLGIGTLTMFAFASANWQRSDEEVAALMALFERYLVDETPRCCREGVRLSLIGRRDRLPPSLKALVRDSERATCLGQTLHLRLAVDYSSREAIVAAARHLAATQGAAAGRREIPPDEFARMIVADPHAGEDAAEVDLLIRTGGEQRLSDFLLWECAFAELYFTDRMWPEFEAADLAAAVAEFSQRERRFGRVPSSA